MSIFYSGLNTFTTSNLTIVNISTANISNLNFTTISNSSVIITNTLINASNASFTNTSIGRLVCGTMINGSTTITGSLMNASNASFTNTSIGTLVCGTLVSGTMINGSTSITGSLMNASNASFTNTSIGRLAFGTMINGSTNITGTLMNSLNASFINISASNIYTVLLDTISNLTIGPTSKEVSIGTSNLNISVTTILGATAEGLGNTCAFNGDGTRIAIGSSTFNLGQGRLQVLEFLNRNWVNMTTINGTTGEGLGNSCAFNKAGNILAVGSSNFNSNRGKIQILQYTTTWSPVVTILGTLVTNTLIGEQLGYSCALNAIGDILAVGSIYYGLDINNPNKGRIQTFQYNTTTWAPISNASVVGDNGDNLGNSCALNATGDILAAGSLTSSGNGKLQMFQYNNVSWINTSTLFGETVENLGNSCALNASGNILAVVSSNFSSNNISRGKLQILQYNISWSNVSTIFGESAEKLGTSCTLNASGDILAVGSSNFNSNRGKLQIFQYNTNWVNISTILGDTAEQLGTSCALNSSGNTLAIGSSNFNSGGGKLQIIQTSMINMYTQNTINIGAFSVNMNYPGCILNTTTINASNASIGSLNFGIITNGSTNITGTLINASNASFTNTSIGSLAFGTMFNGNTNITGLLINASNASFTNASIGTATFTNISTSNIYTVLLDTISNLTIGPGSKQMTLGTSNLNLSNTSILGSILGSSAERLGSSCALSGDGSTLAIGSSNFSSGWGKLQVFKYNNVNLSWVNISTINGTSAEGLGNACALNNIGDILAVSSSNFSSFGLNRGRLQIFKYNNNVSWIPVINIIGDSPVYVGQTIGEQLGTSCALNSTGNIIAFGSINYNIANQPNKGKIQIINYNINSIPWSTITNTSIVGDTAENLGNSCALNADGSIVAAGSLTFSGNGKFQIFQYNNVSWVNVATIVGANAEKLGSSCALNSTGNIAVVGSSNFSSITIRGKIQTLQYNTTNIPWVITNNVSIIGDTTENLGNSCALNASGNILAVGSSNFSSNSITRGKTQIFQYNTNLVNLSTIIGETAEQFGTSCALNSAGNLLAVGSSNFNLGAGKLHIFQTTMTNMYNHNSITIGALSVNMNYPGSALNVNGLITANGGITIPSPQTLSVNTITNSTLEIGRSSSTSRTWYEIVSDQTNLFVDYHNNIITTCDFDARIAVSQVNTATSGTATMTYSAGIHNFNNQVTAPIFNSTSDIRSKNIIRYITVEETLNFINNTNPILFKWKDNSYNIVAGYIAQEVIKTLADHLVYTSENSTMKESADGPEGKQYVLNYDGIIPYHGVAIKHLLQENKNLKEQITELTQNINELSTKNNELFTEINKIKEFIKFN